MSYTCTKVANEIAFSVVKYFKYGLGFVNHHLFRALAVFLGKGKLRVNAFLL